MEAYGKEVIDTGMFENGDYLTVRQLAKALNVANTWVYKRTMRGSCPQLPSYRFGGHIRFKLEEVLNYLKNDKKGL